MNPYIEKLKSYLADSPANSHWENAQSILELLYYIYTEHHPIENATILYQFRELDQLLQYFTLPEHDRFTNLLCDVCTEYSRQAFLTGFHVGFHLSAELEK